MNKIIVYEMLDKIPNTNKRQKSVLGSVETKQPKKEIKEIVNLISGMFLNAHKDFILPNWEIPEHTSNYEIATKLREVLEQGVDQHELVEKGILKKDDNLQDLIEPKLINIVTNPVDMKHTYINVSVKSKKMLKLYRITGLYPFKRSNDPTKEPKRSDSHMLRLRYEVLVLLQMEFMSHFGIVMYPTSFVSNEFHSKVGPKPNSST